MIHSESFPAADPDDPDSARISITLHCVQLCPVYIGGFVFRDGSISASVGDMHQAGGRRRLDLAALVDLDRWPANGQQQRRVDVYRRCQFADRWTHHTAQDTRTKVPAQP